MQVAHEEFVGLNAKISQLEKETDKKCNLLLEKVFTYYYV